MTAPANNNQSETSVVISGSGLFIPPHTISNEELITAYNAYVEKYNKEHQQEIDNNELEALPLSDAAFVEKASGIKSRYVMYKEGMLDPDVMKPLFEPCLEGDEPEVVTMSLTAAKEAMAQANKHADDIDMVIMASSNQQRPYPSPAVEVQEKLGIQGAAFDMGIACSSATFALITAYSYVKAGLARSVLVVNPEFATPQLNLTSRDSHFIFGDVATAAIVERGDLCQSDNAFEIFDTQQLTRYSDNIRCDNNYVDHLHRDQLPEDRPYFKQQGKRVFKELLPMVTRFVQTQLANNHLAISDVKRMWLHQANINMNLFAAKKLLGRLPSAEEAPIVLDEFSNTASSGSLIAFHRHKADFTSGEIGLLCSFGAGYSIGGLLLKKR